MGLQQPEARYAQLAEKQGQNIHPGLEPLDPGHVGADAPGRITENHVLGDQCRRWEQAQLGGATHHHFAATGLAGGIGEKILDRGRVDARQRVTPGASERRDQGDARYQGFACAHGQFLESGDGCMWASWKAPSHYFYRPCQDAN
jgi:hypothetical protein